jgi:hypothetical protein
MSIFKNYNIQSKRTKAEIADILALLRSLDKKKQIILPSATKGLISGIERI